MPTNQSKLSEKWWYRMLKVIYFLAWFISILIIIFLSYSARPQKTQSYSEVSVFCQKEENNFHFKPSDSFFTSLKDDLEWTNTDEDFASKSCEYGLHRSDYAQLPSVPRNYTIDLYFNSYGSWKSVFTTLGIGFITSFTIIEIIKTIILYIIGVNIWRGMLLYGLLFIVALLENDKK